MVRTVSPCSPSGTHGPLSDRRIRSSDRGGRKGEASGSISFRCAACSGNDGDPASGAKVCRCVGPLALSGCLRTTRTRSPENFGPVHFLNAGAGIAGQAARSPFPVGCLPVPDGTWTSAPMRSRVPRTLPPRGAFGKAAIPVILAPGAGIIVGLCRTAHFDRRKRLFRCTSTRCRQRRRQGVCRLSDGRSARFCGHEPIGSERRRVYR